MQLELPVTVSFVTGSERLLCVKSCTAEYVSGVERQQFPLHAFNNHSAPAPLRARWSQKHRSASKVFQYVWKKQLFLYIKK